MGGTKGLVVRGVVEGDTEGQVVRWGGTEGQVVRWGGGGLKDRW